MIQNFKVGETGFTRRDAFGRTCSQVHCTKKASVHSFIIFIHKNVVGETGFEPATLRSQSECATGLRHSP